VCVGTSDALFEHHYILFIVIYTMPEIYNARNGAAPYGDWQAYSGRSGQLFATCWGEKVV
jgi:hypothetical protein